MKKMVLMLCFCLSMAHAETITVFAASSLTEAFQEMGTAFEKKTGHQVRFQFAGSQVLKTQLEQGAQADVFASANDLQFDPLVKRGLVTGKTTFTRNQLAVVVPIQNPAKLRSLSDLAKPGLKLILASPNVPVGQYTRAVFDAFSKSSKGFTARALKNLISEENNVRQVVLKIALGEADAGVVYTTDIVGDNKNKVKTLAIPGKYNVIARYPMGVLKSSKQPEVAQAFVAFVQSRAGQSILKKWGFLPVHP